MILQELFESTEQKSSRPEVYLDMDGVLADFFEEYARLAGNPQDGSGRYNYRNIPPAKTDPTLNKMIGTDFFYRLPKFPTTDALVAMVVKVFGSYNICSSPLRGDHENSGVQKRRWLQDNLAVQPREVIITPQKQKYAVQSDGTPNILIDDRGSNITAWEAAGGVGIKYQADEDSLDVVVQGIKRAMAIIKREREHEKQQLVSRDRSMPVATDQEDLKENLRNWFKEKWVRFGPDGKIRGDCARGSSKEGKPKCLPQAKAHALGKKGRASAAARKRRQDPDADRNGPAKNVATKKESVVEDTNIPFNVCPSCGGNIVHESQLNEKQDACYHKVKSRYKVWPSAYASGALVQCRKKGAANWGKKK